MEIIVGFIVLLLLGLFKKKSDSRKYQEDVVAILDDFDEDSDNYSDYIDSIDHTEQILAVVHSSAKKKTKMSKIVIPKKIFIFSRDHGKSKIEQNNLSIPMDILFFTINDVTYLPIWKEKPIKDFTANLGSGSYIELTSDIFIFNVLMLDVEFDFFIFNPEFDEENELINSNKRISSKKPHLLSPLVSMGLDRMFEIQKKVILHEIDKKSNRSLFEINDQVTNTLFFSTLKNKIINRMSKTEDVEAITQLDALTDALNTLANGFENFDNIITETGQNSQKNKTKIKTKIATDNTEFNKAHIDAFVTSWERRHDKWVIEFLAKNIGSVAKSMTEIRPHLKKKLLNDWRVSLGFILDRTTYQSRKDIINERTANYLFQTVQKCQLSYGDHEIDKIIEQVQNDKLYERATHVREKQDITRLISIGSFLKNSKEKNFTKIVLELFNSKNDVIFFLRQFDFIGDKTASFYMKFIAWVFDLNFIPLAIDRHVIKSLNYHGLLSGESKKDAKNKIKAIASQLNVSAIKIETALYEESWLKSNNIDV